MATKRKKPAVVAGVAVLVLMLVAAGCRTPTPTTPPPDPPPGGAGGGVIGVNPDIASQPGATRTAVSYGPFTVPAARGTAHGQEGMLRNNMAFGIRKPCNDCYITSVTPNLKYADGRVANIDTGQWLHHMVIAAGGKADPNCSASILGFLGERVFASGNERTRVKAPVGYGYRVNTTDSWNLIYDLMNSNMAASRVAIEMTFEWVPASTPGMKPIRPVWLDVNQCGTSEVPAGTGSYQYRYDWTVNVPGKLLGAGGHVHDGGTHLVIKNETTGQMLCTSTARYGGAGYEEPGMEHGDHGMDHGDGGGLHISGMTQCVSPDGNTPVGTLALGQRVSLVAYYNADKHPQHGGHPVMGIAVIYIAAS